MKQAFITISLDTGKAVTTFNELKATAKELEKSLKDLKPDDKGFDELQKKVVLAKSEIFKFNEQLRVTPSFTEKLSNAIKIGMSDVAVRAGKAESAINELKTAQAGLVREINLTSDAVKKNNLVDEFKKIENQIKKNETELHKFNQQLNQGFKENKEAVNGFTLQTDKNFKQTNDTISGAANNIKQSFLGIGQGLVGLFAVDKIKDFVVESAKFYELVQQNEKRLLIALDGRKQVQQELIQQSKELEVKSGIDDQEIVKQQTFLALQGRTQSQIEKTIQAAIGLSRSLDVDLSTAVKQLDGTFQGVSKGMGKFDIELGNLTEAQLLNGEAIDIALEKYGSQITLQGEAANASNNLGIAVENLKEQIGGLVAEGGGINNFLADIVNGFSAFIDIGSKISTPFAFFQSQVEEAANKIRQVNIANSKSAKEEFDKGVKSLIDGGKSAIEAIEQIHTQSITKLDKKIIDSSLKKNTAQKEFFKLTKQAVEEHYSNEILAATKKDKALQESHIKETISSLNKEAELVQVGQTKSIEAEANTALQKIAIQRQVITETAKLQTVQAQNKFSANPEKLKEELDRVENIRLTSLRNLNTKENEIISSGTKKSYEEKLRIIQQSNQNEILSTQSGTVRRVEVEISALQKEKDFQVSHIEEIVQAENKYSVGTVQFAEEVSRRKENIILTSNQKEIELEKSKQQILTQLFTTGQKNKLDLFPEGSIERIQEQIRQVQTTLIGATANANATSLFPVPTFDAAAIVKYSTEIKKLYSELAAHQASVKKTELLTEQSTIQAKLLAAKKGSDEELDLKRQLIANKAALELNEINSKLAAYELIKQAGIQLNADELANYNKLLSDKALATAQANADQNAATLQSDELSRAQKISIATSTVSAIGQIYDTINNLQTQRNQVEIQSIENNLQKQLSSLSKQEEQELKTSTNKEATQAKFRRKKEAAEKEAHQKEAVLKKKQFEADKKAAIIRAVIGGALGVLNALNTQPFFPLGLIMAALAAVVAGVEISAISSQPTPEFSKGGIIQMSDRNFDGSLKTFAQGGIPAQGVVSGSKHTQGGIKLVDGNTGIVKGEIEGDETILTSAVSKNPTLLKQASDINVKAGGVSFFKQGGLLSFQNYTPPKLESGGVLGTQTNVNVNNTVDFELLKSFMAAELSKPRKSYVVSGEITDSQNIESVIERRSKLIA